MDTISKVELAEFIAKQANTVNGENILLQNEISESMRNILTIDAEEHERKMRYYLQRGSILQGKLDMLNEIAVKFLNINPDKK
jgi:excinuclease UvrABC helicase subunit UvrB